jgi:hypothetical protein
LPAATTCSTYSSCGPPQRSATRPSFRPGWCSGSASTRRLLVPVASSSAARRTLDLARPYRDFGPAFLADLLEAYGDLDDDLRRTRFYARCAVLEDLAYGRATGGPEYTRAAERSLQWLFGS